MVGINSPNEEQRGQKHRDRKDAAAHYYSYMHICAKVVVLKLGAILFYRMRCQKFFVSVFVEVIHTSLGQISQPHLFKMLSTVPEVGVLLY